MSDKSNSKKQVNAGGSFFASMFSSLFGKFGTVTGASALSLVTNIPAALLSIFYFLFFFPKIDDFFSVQGFASFFIDNSLCDYERASGLYYLMVLLFTALFLSTSTVSFSVLNCGFQEIFRNIFRNNSVSFFDDFKAGIKKNFKQGIGATLISWVVSAIIFFALGFYRNSFGKIGTLFFVLMMIIYIVFIVSQNIVNQTMTAVDLPLGKQYKNAVLFTFLELDKVFGILIITFILTIIIPWILLFFIPQYAYAFAVIYYILFVFGAVPYMFAFLANHYVNKYLTAPSAQTPSNDIIEDEDDDDDEDSSEITEGEQQEDSVDE